ncbi:MAG: hypothetical protein AAF664_19520, partial [Planctomycetota bacterium]
RRLPSVKSPVEHHSLRSEWIAGGWIGRGNVIATSLVEALTKLHRPGDWIASVAKVSAGVWVSSQLDNANSQNISSPEDRESSKVGAETRRAA